jgi:SAM-dependent methyltransferase
LVVETGLEIPIQPALLRSEVYVTREIYKREAHGMGGFMDAARAAFTDIYVHDRWGLSRMQPNQDRLAGYATLVQEFMRCNDIHSVAEFGCGFWTYAKLIDWTGITYDGYDVVPLVISWNTQRHGAANIRFRELTDSTKPAPVDLVICKDVLQHLPNDDVARLLPLLKQTAPLLLIINDVMPDSNTNGPIERGGYRAIQLDQAPFGEACMTLHEWESVDFGVTCRKRAVLVRGMPRPA